MSFEIEKGIPIIRPIKRKYPFAEMEVDDSFFVPTAIAKYGAVSNACATAGLKLNRRFSLRKQPDGVRVWRLE